MAYPQPGPGQSPVPLDQPLYNAGFGAAVKRFFTKYATFSGRASLSEYWWAALFNALVSVVASLLLAIAIVATGDRQGDPETWRPSALTVTLMVLFAAYGLAVIVPSIAVSVRRLHDANYSGWFYLLSLVPGVGGLIVLIFMLLPTNPQGARFDTRQAAPQVP